MAEALSPSAHGTNRLNMNGMSSLSAMRFSNGVVTRLAANHVFANQTIEAQKVKKKQTAQHTAKT